MSNSGSVPETGDRWESSTGLPPRHGEVDAVTSLGLLAVGLVLIRIDMVGLWGPGGIAASVWWFAVPLTVMALLVALRRKYPLSCMAGGFAVFAAEAFTLGGSIGALLMLIELIYSGAHHGRPRIVSRLRRLVWALVALSTVLALAITQDVRWAVLIGLQVFAIVGTSFWWGSSSRQQFEIAALERDKAVADARTRERTQMAAELHDALSGNLSAIAINAQAGLRSTELAPEALRTIQTLTTRGMSELHALIDVLRPHHDADDAVVSPKLGELDALISEARAAGLDVSMDAPSSMPALASAVDHVAYRIVQESLHNATRHAAGGRAVVRLAPGEDGLEVEVRSVAPSALSGTTASPNGSRLGLTSMRERTEALGGTFAAGMDDGEWVVRAVLP